MVYKCVRDPVGDICCFFFLKFDLLQVRDLPKLLGLMTERKYLEMLGEIRKWWPVFSHDVQNGGLAQEGIVRVLARRRVPAH